MTEKKPDNNTAIIVGGYHRLSAPRSKLISRGREIAESLEKRVVTIVRDIIVDIDTRGYLEKQAITDAVNLYGKETTRFFLGHVFNEKYLSPERRKWNESDDIRIGDTLAFESIGGDTLTFESSNDYLDWWQPKVVKEKRTGNEKIFAMSVKCPACGSKIETLEPDSAYYCTANDCPGRIKAQIMAFSDSMHIDLSSELAKDLIDKKTVLDAADLYFLKKRDLIRLNKMDEKSAQRVLDAVGKSRHTELHNIIIALLETLGIRSGVAIEVAVHCNSINDLFDAGTIALLISKWYSSNDVIAIQKLINAPKILKFLKKLKRGGVVFPIKRGV